MRDDRRRSARRRAAAAWCALFVGACTGTAVAWGTTSYRDARYTEYDQPAFHVLTHLPVAVFALTVAVSAAVARRWLPRRSTSRAAATMLLAVFGWFGLAQVVEASGALVAASPRNPGADGTPLHVLGLLLTAATAPTIVVVVGATLVARRRQTRARTAPCDDSADPSSAGRRRQPAGAG